MFAYNIENFKSVDMKRVKFVIYADKEEIKEFDDNVSEKEIQEEFDRWVDNNTECYWEEDEG